MGRIYNILLIRDRRCTAYFDGLETELEEFEGSGSKMKYTRARRLLAVLMSICICIGSTTPAFAAHTDDFVVPQTVFLLQSTPN